MHKYNIIKEDSDGILEVCERCKKRLVTKKGKNEVIDNVKYGKEHRRDILQVYDKEFEQEYGDQE